MTSRSAADATRFTATEPHAYSKPTPTHSSTTAPSSGAATTHLISPATTSSHMSSAIPPNGNAPLPSPQIETPREKVARLRAARLAQRGEQLTTWERTVIRGRVWADRVHRFTALSLIGFTLIAAGVTTFALTDMILHNRRKRNAFYAEQHTIYQTRLVAAIETEKAGLPLDEDQTLIMARERAKVDAAERKHEKSFLSGLTGMFTGGLKKDMEEPIVVPSESAMLERMGVSSVGVLEASDGKVRVNETGDVEGVEQTGLAKAVKQKREEMGLEERMGPAEIRSTAQERRGGMLDRIGEQTASGASSKGSSLGGWLSWGTSR